MAKKRILSGWETNHLLRHGYDPLSIHEDNTIPVQYITGYAEFMDKEFAVSQETLIPRIETEDLVDLVRNFALRTFDKKQNLTIADIGTGSGVIGISLFLELEEFFPDLHIAISDVSPQALSVARRNIRSHLPINKSGSIKVFESDLLLDYPDHFTPQIIVANLPYIPSKRMSQLDPSVINFEPELALDGKDAKGLKIIGELVKQSEKLVQRPEAIFLEIDEYVHPQDLPQTSFYTSRIKKDLFDKNRFAIYELIKE